MRNYVDFIEGTDGKAVAGAFVRVLNYPSGTNATLYADGDGVVSLANPVRSDNTGEFSFYVADGHYTLEITGTGLATQTVTDIAIFDPTDVMEGAAAVVIVAGIAADVTAVAAIAGDVTTVAANINASSSAAAASAAAALVSEQNAAASAAAAALLRGGNLVHTQEFTGAGPYTLSDPSATSILAIRNNGQGIRLSKFTLSNGNKTATLKSDSGLFISSTAEVDVDWI